MTLADPRSLGLRPKFAVTFTLPGVDSDMEKEIQRAPDSSGSSGTFSRLAIIGGAQTEYIDVLPNDGDPRWYRWRWRHAPGHEGNWSAEFSATPRRLKRAPAMFSEVQREADNNTTVREAAQRITDAGHADNTILVGGFSPGRHIVPGTARDDEEVTFSQDYDTTPKFAFVPQIGRAHVGSGTDANFGDVDQRLDMVAENPTVAGFDMRAKNMAAKSFSSQTDGFSAGRNTASPENGDVTLSADGDDAYSNLEDANTESALYEAYFDVTQPSSPPDPPSSLTVHLEASDAATGGSFTELDANTYGSGSNLTSEKLSGQATLGANYDLRLRISGVNVSGNYTVTAHGEDHATEPGVQWERDDGTTVLSMTPDANDKVLYLPVDAAVP